MSENVLQQPSNVVKLAFGGDGPNEHWLKDLAVGTVFLSRRKSNSIEATKDFTIGEFCIYNKTEKAILLLLQQGGGPPQPIWVDPIRYSNQMDCIEILRENAFQEVGEEDDEGDRAV